MIYAMPAADIPFLLEKEAGTYPRDTGAGCMIGSKLAENSKETGLKLGARVQIGKRDPAGDRRAQGAGDGV